MRIDIDNNWLVVKYSDNDTKYIIRMDTVIAVEKEDGNIHNNAPQIIIVTTKKEYTIPVFNGDVPDCERWESRDKIFNRVMNATLQYTKEKGEKE